MELGLSGAILALRKDFSEYCGRRLLELGLAPGLLYFVIYLGKHPGSSPGQLAAALRADSGHTARSVEKLVRGGFVLREPNPVDRRACLLTLTPRGAEAFAEIQAMFARWDTEAAQGLSPEEGRELRRLLKEVLNSRRQKTKGDTTP